MAKDNIKITENLTNVVELLNDDEVRQEMGEAYASFMDNPTVTWAKFVLTDDRTNANGERIPETEFPNLMKSGIYMPVKMALGEISAGHPGTKPLGTITHLKKVQLQDGAAAIVAIAALWGQERPADVEFIKQRMAEKQPVDVSWEILYEDATLNAEAGSMDLAGTVLRAATIVGNPAYQGRTQFLSIAARKISDATIVEESEDTQEQKPEDGLMEKTELEARVAELEPKLNEVQAQVEAANKAIAEKDAEIARLTEESAAKDTELVELREYKASIEAEVQKVEKLSAIKTKFVEAGITEEDEYFDKNAERFLKMEEDDLAFFITEKARGLASEAGKHSNASTNKTTKIPAVTGADDDDVSITSLAKHLREQRKK
jgi:uncharacterized coiled-coil protein SlyX